MYCIGVQFSFIVYITGGPGLGWRFWSEHITVKCTTNVYVYMCKVQLDNTDVQVYITGVQYMCTVEVYVIGLQ